MTSQDSGIETGNDSNDSSYPQRDSNESSPTKVENFLENFRYQTPASLSSQIQSKLNKLSIGHGVTKPSTSSQPEASVPNAERNSEREGDSLHMIACSAHPTSLPENWKRTTPKNVPENVEEFRLPNPRFSAAVDMEDPQADLSYSFEPEVPNARVLMFASSAHSTSSLDENKEVGLPMFRLPNPRSSTLNVDPPAGISFSNLQPSSLGMGNGYEIIGQDFVYRNIELQLKLKAVRCRLRNARDAWTQFKTPLDERKLRRAVSMNNCEQVESLLAAGVNPNSSDAHKRTPLHLASCRGYTEILRMLLARGADPNKKDALGNTPLHIAACTNNVEVVTLLIKAGTDVSTGDNSGRNPLQIAQSKLKLLQRCRSEDATRVKAEVAQVVEMMQTFFNKRGQETEAELLLAFSSRLSLSDTPAQVEVDVRDLLASLSGLSLGQSNQ